MILSLAPPSRSIPTGSIQAPGIVISMPVRLACCPVWRSSVPSPRRSPRRSRSTKSDLVHCIALRPPTAHTIVDTARSTTPDPPHIPDWNPTCQPSTLMHDLTADSDDIAHDGHPPAHSTGHSRHCSLSPAASETELRCTVQRHDRDRVPVSSRRARSVARFEIRARAPSTDLFRDASTRLRLIPLLAHPCRMDSSLRLSTYPPMSVRVGIINVQHFLPPPPVIGHVS
ncbi:uncharacterized protein B0H18DRAFT_526318 [Fomitopsis serialis]|uniref:uncharacterized protein n=1 Tax=Fomitopsis serialis TaxID=139415 RepID=UPI002008B2B4|nr:uncharacterized protein B0H18DRAFT_526318 [Neoantrodia serialis]KAH9922051.1 hypothetical protein B0H18DRAFT_526318 [Neoantrodia serialis]